jgi:Transposase zinc-ribbon domain
LSLEVTSEADAFAYFEKLRWNGNPVCAHCDTPHSANHPTEIQIGIALDACSGR